MSTRHGTKHFKLLVNKAKNDKEAKSVYLSMNQAIDRFLNSVVVEYIGYIPEDEALVKSVLKRKPVMELFPNALSCGKFHEIAGDILEMPRRHDADGNIKFFLQRFMDYRIKNVKLS